MLVRLFSDTAWGVRVLDPRLLLRETRRRVKMMTNCDWTTTVRPSIPALHVLISPGRLAECGELGTRCPWRTTASFTSFNIFAGIFLKEVLVVGH